MKNFKILHLISSSGNSGPFNVIINILKNIDKLVYSVDCFTYKQSFKLDRSHYVISLGFYHKFFSNFLLLFCKIHKNKYDIIHTHCYSSLIIAIFFKNNAKHVHTFHAYPEFQNNYIYGRIKGSVINFFIFKLYKYIDLPLACSSSVADEFYKFKNLRLDYVMNGISDNYNGLLKKSEIRKKYNFNDDNIYFITICRLSKEKNIKYLVDSFIKAEINKSKLIVIGDGPLYSDIEVMGNKDVIMIQYTDVVFDYLFCSDYYLSASKIEGMSLSTLEAMSAFLPIVISNILPHKYIFSIANAPKFGEIFDLDDKNGLINSIKRVLEFDYKKLSDASRLVFLNHFNAEIMTENYCNIYNKLLNE